MKKLLRGNSGATVEYFPDLEHGPGVVRKSVIGAGRALDRLRVSCMKQMLVLEHPDYDFFPQYVPDVLGTVDAAVLCPDMAEECFGFDMTYATGEHIALLEEPEAVDVVSDLMVFLQKQLSYSVQRTISDKWLARAVPGLVFVPNVFGDRALVLNEAAEACRKMLRGDIRIPCGPCHGDLTFSNVIVGREVNLIDFSWQPFESVVWDVAKLMQETRHAWSWRAEKPDGLGDVALPGWLSWLDGELVALSEPWAPYVDAFDLLVLLRIAPYTFDGLKADWLVEEIGRCLERLS